MSEQPQETDHELCVRLAKLCKLPREWGSGVYPCVLEDRAGLLRLVQAGDGRTSEPWNPLKDERQAWRYVVKALGRMGCAVTACALPATVVGVVYGAEVLKEGDSVKPAIVSKVMGTFENVARPICLAALEAWEKLEERDGN